MAKKKTTIRTRPKGYRRSKHKEAALAVIDRDLHAWDDHEDEALPVGSHAGSGPGIAALLSAPAGAAPAAPPRLSPAPAVELATHPSVLREPQVMPPAAAGSPPAAPVAALPATPGPMPPATLLQRLLQRLRAAFRP